ncbi:hypothetical protein J7M28_07610 [bacterium]|nr:hypothetical protein [bacterium]
MKKILVLTVGLLLLGSLAFADWDDAGGRGIFPYWQSGGNWYSLLVFVNGSEETNDILYLRFMDDGGRPCSDTTGDMYNIRAGEQLMFSTVATVPVWIPTTAGYGSVLFRVQDGGYLHPYLVIYNEMTSTGYAVPAYRQDGGF